MNTHTVVVAILSLYMCLHVFSFSMFSISSESQSATLALWIHVEHSVVMCLASLNDTSCSIVWLSMAVLRSVS